MQISEQLKAAIANNQLQLANAMILHQKVYKRCKGLSEVPDDLKRELAEKEQLIVHFGCEQKKFFSRLREQVGKYNQVIQTTAATTAAEERRDKLSNALNRARKQNLVPEPIVSPPPSTSRSHSDNSNPPEQASTSPIDCPLPTVPDNMSQEEFMGVFDLVTFEVSEAMENRRAERKRRSTANPQYCHRPTYSGPPVRKKRTFYLNRPPSPPVTRGRKKQELARSMSKSPPTQNTTGTNHSGNKTIVANGRTGSKHDAKPCAGGMPAIPNLPSGLVIERISATNSGSDTKQCIVCKQPGVLSICEQCSRGFHMSCHNRPFSKPPTDCPKCLSKDNRRSTTTMASGSSNNGTMSAGMTISYLGPTMTEEEEVEEEEEEEEEDQSEKLQIKHELEMKRSDLVAELTQLQNRHSELTISLRKQEQEKRELQRETESREKQIEKLVLLIGDIRSFTPPNKDT